VLKLYCWWYGTENFKGVISLRWYQDFWKFSSCFRKYRHVCAHVWLPEWPWLCLSVHTTQNLNEDLPNNVMAGILSRTQSPLACFIGVWSIRYVTVNILFYFWEALSKYRSRYSSVGIATHYGLEGPGIGSWWGEIFRTYPYRLRGPPTLLYDGYWVFPGGKGGRGVMLTTHPLLVQRLRKSWAIPTLTLWVLLGLLRGSPYYICVSQFTVQKT
jgi:hypothetical protein